MRTYAAVVVRGEEDRGVRLWAFGKMIYQDLLKLMLDEDYGDITDPLEGRDVKVSVTKTPGKQYADTKVTPRGTTSPLSKDKDQIKTWLSSIPNIDDYEELTPVEEIEKRVNDWLGGGSEPSSPEKEVGLTRGNKSDSIENDLAELRGNKPASAPVKKKTMDDLEDAFADLE